MSSTCLRDGSAADIDAIMAVMERAFDPAFGEAWNRGQCTGILSLPDVWLVLALDAKDERPIGFALSRLLVEEAELLLLAVVPEARCHGIGAALVERSGDLARARGARRLLLEMRENNPAARLYEASGFAPIGRRPGYYRAANGALHDALTLARSID